MSESRHRWEIGDPREVIDKANGLVIVIWTGTRAITGIVQNNHGYYIELIPEVFGGRRRGAGWIGEDDDWEPEWRWTLPPAAM